MKLLERRHCPSLSTHPHILPGRRGELPAEFSMELFCRQSFEKAFLF